MVVTASAVISLAFNRLERRFAESVTTPANQLLGCELFPLGVQRKYDESSAFTRALVLPLVTVRNHE